MSDIYLHNLRQRAAEAEQENRAFLKKLKQHAKKLHLDELVHELHQEAFSKFDCLECANCCSSISPILQDKDINRISRVLRIKPAQFSDRYLKKDEEGDYVFRQTPCPFLMPDNYCSIYSHRPRSCREYPYTNQPNFHKTLSFLIRDTYICPAIFYIVEQLKIRLKNNL